MYTVDESSGSVQITLILSNQLSTEITVTVTDELGNATSKSINMRIVLLKINYININCDSHNLKS